MTGLRPEGTCRAGSRPRLGNDIRSVQSRPDLSGLTSGRSSRARFAFDNAPHLIGCAGRLDEAYAHSTLHGAGTHLVRDALVERDVLFASADDHDATAISNCRRAKARRQNTGAAHRRVGVRPVALAVRTFRTHRNRARADATGASRGVKVQGFSPLMGPGCASTQFHRGGATGPRSARNQSSLARV